MTGDRLPNRPWNPASPFSVLELEATEGVAQERKQDMSGRSLKRKVGMLVMPLALLGAVVMSQAQVQAGAAQATPVATPAAAGTISVTGVGEVIVVPDTANIQIGVQVFNEELAEAQRQSTEQITTIIDTIKAAGIADKDIQTSNYSVSIRQQYDPNTGIATEVLGYDIYNTLSVTVRDLDELGTILDQVVSAGANQIYGIYFFTSDLTKATEQARTAAVEDAKARATQLAEAAGVEVGRIVNISEGFSSAPLPTDYGKGGRGAGMAEDAAAVPVQPGTQTVQISVSVTYEIAG
jgi:uncharacterized protein YggE